MSDKLAYIIIIISLIILILLSVFFEPSYKNTTPDNKPKVRVSPHSGAPVVAPGNSRIGIDLKTGTPILVL